jgi:hypothetical protein
MNPSLNFRNANTNYGKGARLIVRLENARRTERQVRLKGAEKTGAEEDITLSLAEFSYLGGSIWSVKGRVLNCLGVWFQSCLQRE